MITINFKLKENNVLVHFLNPFRLENNNVAIMRSDRTNLLISNQVV